VLVDAALEVVRHLQSRAGNVAARPQLDPKRRQMLPQLVVHGRRS
jgi:hypothetical protein